MSDQLKDLNGKVSDRYSQLENFGKGLKTSSVASNDATQELIDLLTFANEAVLSYCELLNQYIKPPLEKSPYKAGITTFNTYVKCMENPALSNVLKILTNSSENEKVEDFNRSKIKTAVDALRTAVLNYQLPIEEVQDKECAEQLDVLQKNMKRFFSKVHFLVNDSIHHLEVIRRNSIPCDQKPSDYCRQKARKMQQEDNRKDSCLDALYKCIKGFC